MHDVNPRIEALQQYPKAEGSRNWCGNVWRTAVALRLQVII
jgi:hypothetical protein